MTSYNHVEVAPKSLWHATQAAAGHGVHVSVGVVKAHGGGKRSGLSIGSSKGNGPWVTIVTPSMPSASGMHALSTPHNQGTESTQHADDVIGAGVQGTNNIQTCCAVVHGLLCGAHLATLLAMQTSLMPPPTQQHRRQHETVVHQALSQQPCNHVVAAACGRPCRGISCN